MEITLAELMVLQSALINVKSFLRQNSKPDTNEMVKK
jgi:hypothetical protein